MTETNLDFDLNGTTVADYMHIVCGNFVRLKYEEEGWGVTKFSNNKMISKNDPKYEYFSKTYYGQEFSNKYWYGYDIETIPVNGNSIYFMPMIHNNVRINKNKVLHQLKLEYKEKQRQKMWNILIHLHARGGKGKSLGKCIPLDIGHKIWEFTKDF